MMIQHGAERGESGPGDRPGQENRLMPVSPVIPQSSVSTKTQTDYSWKLAVTRDPPMTDLFGKFCPVPCGEEFVGRLVDNYNKTAPCAL